MKEVSLSSQVAIKWVTLAGCEPYPLRRAEIVAVVEIEIVAVVVAVIVASGGRVARSVAG